MASPGAVGDQGALFPDLVDRGRRAARPPAPEPEVREVGGLTLPVLVADAGGDVAACAVDWLTAEHRNANTRDAYARSVAYFCGFLEALGVDQLGEVETPHVAAWVEWMGRDRRLADASVKQRLAAVRSFYGYLERQGAAPAGARTKNPAERVRGPKVEAEEGRTPWLTEPKARELLDSLAADRSMKGRRDLALVGVSLTSLLRARAVLAMRVGDFVRLGDLAAYRVREKGGQRRTVQAVDQVAAWVKRWIDEAELEGSQALWPGFAGRGGGRVRDTAMSERGYLKLVKARAAGVGVDPDAVGVHTLRRTGAMMYLAHGGDVRELQAMMGHKSLRTTARYLAELEGPGAGAYGRILGGNAGDAGDVEDSADDEPGAATQETRDPEDAGGEDLAETDLEEPTFEDRSEEAAGQEPA